MKQNKRKLLVMALVLTMLLGAATPAYAAAETNSAFSEPKTSFLDVVPFIENGRTYAPVRALAEAFGIYVQWDADTQTVTLTRGSVEVNMRIGSKTLTKKSPSGTSSTSMDVAPVLRGGRTMLPVRFWAEAFGLEVGWEAETRSVALSEGVKSLSFVIGEKTLTLTGGHFLQVYDKSQRFRFFYPASKDAVNLWEGLTGSPQENIAYMMSSRYSVVVMYTPGDELTPPVRAFSDIETLVAQMPAEETLSITRVSILGQPAFRASQVREEGVKRDTTLWAEAAVIFFYDGCLCEMAVSVTPSGTGGQDALLAEANQLLDELLPSLTLINADGSLVG